MPNGRPEDLELATHGNESLAAVRRKIIRLYKQSDKNKLNQKNFFVEFRRRGYSQSSRLDLYVNGELVNPVEDKKLIHQLPFRDKQVNELAGNRVCLLSEKCVFLVSW